MTLDYTKADLRLHEVLNIIFTEFPQFSVYRGVLTKWLQSNLTHEQKVRMLTKIYMALREEF